MLHGAIDDATGTDPVLVFRATDDLHGYGILLQKLCNTYVCPWSSTAIASASLSATISTFGFYWEPSARAHSMTLSPTPRPSRRPSLLSQV